MDTGQKTIRDFGEQWTTYDNADGYFGSLSLLARPDTQFSPGWG